jgi:hypothetical protein
VTEGGRPITQTHKGDRPEPRNYLLNADGSGTTDNPAQGVIGVVLRENGLNAPSVFQAMLPAELLVQERLDVWRRRPIFGRTLERLRNARLVEIAVPSGLELDGA